MCWWDCLKIVNRIKWEIFKWWWKIGKSILSKSWSLVRRMRDNRCGCGTIMQITRWATIYYPTHCNCTFYFLKYKNKFITTIIRNNNIFFLLPKIWRKTPIASDRILIHQYWSPLFSIQLIVFWFKWKPLKLEVGALMIILTTWYIFLGHGTPPQKWKRRILESFQEPVYKDQSCFS